ncbi:MAG: gluconate kinase [Gorillibacterium sp.]|nr:gluconate kinase [Gorillibacterium sp.]
MEGIHYMNAYPKSYVVAADIGTTSAKTLLVTKEGKIVASHSVHYPMNTPSPEIAEQDPEVIFQAVVTGIAELLHQSGISGDQVLCVSFSSAMHSLMAVSQQGCPLTPLITWADNRSASYASLLRANGEGKRIYERTGTPIHPMSPLIKLMWLKDNLPDVFAQADKFIGIKEYVFYRLFNSYVIDYSIASATGLFNLTGMDWDELALDHAGITAERLSRLVPASHQESGLTLEMATTMGLSVSTPFVVGAADGPLANLGAGAIDPGIFALSIGTSGAVRSIVNQPLVDPEGRLFCYALADGLWTIGGPINNGGIVFRWTRDVLASLEAEEGLRRGLDPYDYLTELAHDIDPGAGGLIFLPFLLGERAPYWNANARGVFFGLSMSHNKKHMIRAVMEGIVYRLHSVVNALEELAGPAFEIRASGGFARSSLWRQMLADVMDKPVTVMASVESSGLGAAYIGFWAMGEFPDLFGVKDWVQCNERHTSDQECHSTYKELTDIYERVYHQLSGEFDAIAEYQQRAQKNTKLNNQI